MASDAVFALAGHGVCGSLASRGPEQAKRRINMKVSRLFACCALLAFTGSTWAQKSRDEERLTVRAWAPPTLLSQVSPVSLVVPATRVSSRALSSAKPLIAEATSRSNIAPKSAKTVTSTATIDHVVAMGLDKFGKLF